MNIKQIHIIAKSKMQIALLVFRSTLKNTNTNTCKKNKYTAISICTVTLHQYKY